MNDARLHQPSKTIHFTIELNPRRPTNINLKTLKHVHAFLRRIDRAWWDLVPAGQGRIKAPATTVQS